MNKKYVVLTALISAVVIWYSIGQNSVTMKEAIVIEPDGMFKVAVDTTQPNNTQVTWGQLKDLYA